MKLYHKQLNSVEALKREMHVLKYAHKQSRKEAMKPLAGVGGKFTSKKKKTEDGEDMLAMLGDFVTSGSVVNMLMTFAVPLLKVVGKKAEKGVLKPVLFEVLGGYVKWKLISFGLKTLRKFVESKKKKSKT